MMASIRLFGRGRGAARTGGRAALDAARIAEALESLATASMSTTWRCRHGSGTAIGEGAVDFAAHRSRATVIRGKYAFEYVRVGSTAYRATALDDEDNLAPSAAPSASAELDDVAERDESDESEVEDGVEADLLDAEAAEAADEQDADEDGHEAEDQAAGEDAPDAGAQDESLPVRAWQSFSEQDACGLHAYAEPRVLAAAVRAAAALDPAGTREIDGRTLDAYTVTLKPKPADPDRLLARLARQLRDHGANTLVLTAFVDPAETAGAEPDAENDDASDDGSGGEGGVPRIVRLRLELAHWTPADDPTADHAVTVDLFEFGEPVRIEAPARGVTRRTSRSCADLALF
ncbi:hypothetical protein KGA66_23950 [Actinocrinis puniceicyclus]|uniref:Uncharacterized protein n=1 Tax=Actinocrinis puniceicyclus TaxID=977794 RepID=A0A8J7WUP5_9ACTN|nr:hypothetical protein [Actinocrinis puniceicyclus]MBS2966120.1 hypothetical protein [Actinocrinis puniceicyclus]